MRGVWELKYEDFSSTSVNMLGVTVFKLDGGRGLAVKPFFKPTQKNLSLFTFFVPCARGP